MHFSILKTSKLSFSDQYLQNLMGRRQANLCFHFGGSGENLPDIAKSRSASMDNNASINSKCEHPPGNLRSFAPIFSLGPGDLYHLNCPGDRTYYQSTKLSVDAA